MLTYDRKLDLDPEWAMEEGDRHFSENSEAFKTLKRLIPKLDSLGVPYAVVGGLALFRHGYRRYTDDVDLLVTAESLKIIHAGLEGLGYLPPFSGSKHLRDTTSNVRIEFLVAGQFPGDGKPKPVAFPDPAQESVDLGGIKVLSLHKIIDLKLASGLSNERRMKDLVDVQSLIETLHLPADFAEKLDPSVRDKFLDLHRIVTQVPDPYENT